MKDPRIIRTMIVGLFAFASAHAQDGTTNEEPAAEAKAPAEDSADTAGDTAEDDNAAASLKAAAAKLAEAGSYTWTQTAGTPMGNREPRVTTGKKGSGGFVMLSMPGRDGNTEILFHGEKAVSKGADGGEWAKVEAPAEGAGGGGGFGRRGGFAARMIQNFEEPTAEAVTMVSNAMDVKMEGEGTYVSKLSEEAARGMMTFGRRRGGGGPGGAGGGMEPPPITGLGGTVTFTVKDGVLTGYEVQTTGTMNFNGQDRDIGRTTKVSFENLGSTSFDIPEVAAGLMLE